MSCCGRNRVAQRPDVRSFLGHPRIGAAPGSTGNRPVNQSTFEYIGPTALSVIGPATGATYKFSQTGARLSVHGSDAPSFLSVPGLKPVA